jgi:hypothetical protein
LLIQVRVAGTRPQSRKGTASSEPFFFEASSKRGDGGQQIAGGRASGGAEGGGEGSRQSVAAASREGRGGGGEGRVSSGGAGGGGADERSTNGSISLPGRGRPRSSSSSPSRLAQETAVKAAGAVGVGSGGAFSEFRTSPVQRLFSSNEAHRSPSIMAHFSSSGTEHQRPFSSRLSSDDQSIDGVSTVSSPAERPSSAAASGETQSHKP